MKHLFYDLNYLYYMFSSWKHVFNEVTAYHSTHKSIKIKVIKFLLKYLPIIARVIKRYVYIIIQNNYVLQNIQIYLYRR